MAFINLINTFKESISSRVQELLRSEFQLEDVDTTSFKFETPPDEKMGHLAFACFPLARLAKKAPPQIAGTLAENWGDSETFEAVKATGPYLNFFFNPAYLADALFEVSANRPEYGNTSVGDGKTIMVEYSAPNTNKPLHLGHGRNNLLGMVLSNLLEANSYRVVKANLINDRGVHICKSMLAYQKWGNDVSPESEEKKGDKLVGDFYVLYDKQEKENPELIEEVQQMLRDWEAGVPEIIDLWKMMNGWVLKGFEETYQRMGASFDKVYLESETYKGGKELVMEALEKGICYKEENGAIAIDLENEKLGRKILLRGDGTAMYMTQDINTTVTKFNDYPLNGCFFVVGSEQENHFRILFRTLKKFGYDWADHCEHISYGMVMLPEGKMKSREGTVVDLDELMDEMKSMALEEIKERRNLGSEDIDDEVLDTAEAIGQAAIKYFMLRTGAVKDISFNPKESLSFEGATGPYLQYTHARISSVLRKADFEIKTGVYPSHQWNKEEITVMILIARFPDIIEQSAKDRNPAVLCSYIYDLCRAYNKFYYDHQILKAEDENTVMVRLNLTTATKGVLNKTLNMLSITPLDKM